MEGCPNWQIVRPHISKEAVKKLERLVDLLSNLGIRPSLSRKGPKSGQNFKSLFSLVVLSPVAKYSLLNFFYSERQKVIFLLKFNPGFLFERPNFPMDWSGKVLPTV